MSEVAEGNLVRVRQSLNWSLIGSYLFVVPAVLMFLTFSLYPFIDVFVLSVHDWNGISATRTFVGLENFRDIIFRNPAWWISFKNAGLITLLALTIQNS